MQTEYVTLKPGQLRNVALSFSGGGFRAASFCLGCLSYFETIKVEEKKLTDQVKFISSASGGTITNLAYTMGQRKGESFQAFYKRLNESFLNGTGLIDNVFRILNDPAYWNSRPNKSRNMINAFAIAYDELLFNNESFGIYWDLKNNGVQEVCATTTEFDNAMQFRFQNVRQCGNWFLHFKTEALSTLKKIKLGDILACSSCFPVGFEPFMFPIDFSHESLPVEELQGSMYVNPQYTPGSTNVTIQNCNENQNVCFGLMDGGIDDNQAIAAFMTAEDSLQRTNKFGYDLYITCDVSSNYTGGFDFPNENKKSFFQKFSIIQYLFLFLILFALGIVGIKLQFFPLWSSFLAGMTTVAIFVSFVLCLLGYSAYKKSQQPKTYNTYGVLIFKHIWFFLKLRLSTFLQLLDSRLQSTGYLAAVVFLKKIRRSSYDRLFEKISEWEYGPNGELLKDDKTPASKIVVKHWKMFALQNAVYLLTRKNNTPRIDTLREERDSKWFEQNPTVIFDGKVQKLFDFMAPSNQIQDVASIATEMDTTLWFDNHHINNNAPAALIATGQFTSCYNLLRYAFRFDSKDTYWKTIQDSLVRDWGRFKEDAYWMYDTYKQQ